MNYEQPTIETSPNSEIKRAEIAANRFFDMSEKARAEEEQYPQEERYKEEMFSNIAQETAHGNFTQAQYLLERGAQWNDTLRGAATEINQLEQGRIGAKPMSFIEAQKSIGGYARSLDEVKEHKMAAEIDEIIGGTSRPGTEGIDVALKYIESTLKSHVNRADFTSKGRGGEALADWQEKRSIRDALYQEKQRRIQQMQKPQRTTEEVVITNEDVKRRQEEDQRKIEQIRAELGLNGATRTPAEGKPQQERVVNEPKVINPFQALVDSPETYLENLKDYNNPNTYSPKKAISAVIEVMQKLYPDKKQRVNRIQEIFGQYNTTKDEYRKQRPGIDEFSYEAFATNQTAQRLSESEQQMLKKIIADKVDPPAGSWGKITSTKEYVLGSFIQFLEGIKN